MDFCPPATWTGQARPRLHPRLSRLPEHDGGRIADSGCDRRRPTNLLLSIMAAREGAPLPAMLEALMMEIAGIVSAPRQLNLTHTEARRGWP
ncbi:MAG: hypothetical protein ACOY94_07605 [Bacillota bacterium]